VLKIATDSSGFFREAHPKLRPLETQTPGIFLAGCCQGPKDIAETLTQALGAAAKVNALLAHDRLSQEPTVTTTRDGRCARCGLCIRVCPREARSFAKNGRVVALNEALCDGCGICAAVCPGNAIDQRNYTDEQVYEMLRAMLE
jgi:heterodisulfide reductase subunit A